MVVPSTTLGSKLLVSLIGFHDIFSCSFWLSVMVSSKSGNNRY